MEKNWAAYKVKKERPQKCEIHITYKNARNWAYKNKENWAAYKNAKKCAAYKNAKKTVRPTEMQKGSGNEWRNVWISAIFVDHKRKKVSSKLCYHRSDGVKQPFSYYCFWKHTGLEKKLKRGVMWHLSLHLQNDGEKT